VRHAVSSTALASWHLPSEPEALEALRDLEEKFPDDETPEDFWHSASSKQFRDFFTWGHNHDFGHGVSRAGAMEDRHIQITSEAVQMGFLPSSLENKKVLDIGYWLLVGGRSAHSRWNGRGGHGHRGTS